MTVLINSRITRPSLSRPRNAATKIVDFSSDSLQSKLPVPRKPIVSGHCPLVTFPLLLVLSRNDIRQPPSFRFRDSQKRSILIAPPKKGWLTD
jgi:hypothetical protein